MTSPFPDEYLQARARYRAFMEEHVYPNEAGIQREDEEALALLETLRGRAREAGLWAPHVPPEAGGTGLGFLYYACLNEEIGRSAYAQLVFGCQAPDAGNAEILHLFGTDEQKDRFLRPLVAGEARSFFAMTEPEVAGSDPTLLRTRAVREGDEWVIDGHKWFSSGADGAAFAVVFAISDPGAEPHRRGTMILVPADAPGVEVVRPVPVLGHTGRGWSTHCEVRFTGVRVPVSNTLGGEGEAFRLAQKRLGPGRIHHVMRWLGQMQRAFELMCRYANEREAFGGPLAEKQTVQNWVADSAADIQACRLLTMDAARKVDDGSEARVEISLLKVFAARVLGEVIDRAVQVHGARGLTDETPLGAMLMMARAARIYDGPDEVHRMVAARRILASFREGDGWQFS
ncbi:MAG TPA: acyl-CoA dehydrogenase family protein [Gaiella sp.]|nr:acyl-CoA dehydrogenase family protein [Gaiella sp.]